MSNSRSQVIVCLSALLLLLSPAGAQPSDTPTDAYGQYQNFSPSMAVIIVVLIAALFFMGFFSIYIRHCSDSSAVGSVRQLGASLRRRAAARGLERSVIEGFPTFVYAEVKEEKIGKGALECAVCLNEFEDDDTLRLIPKCDHVFHPECIDAWLESHVTCPVCRANLSPQQGEAVEPAESQNEPAETAETVNRTDGEVSIQITDDQPEQQEAALPPLPPPPPQVVDRNQSVNRNRPPRSRSVRPKLWPRFPRSHSTGHSLVQPGENTDRFTLRLPQDVRKQVMTRALKRTTSCVMPPESSSRRGYRTGSGEGSSRGGRSFKRLDSVAKSDRWVFSMAPPFFSRASSIRSPRVMAADGEASTSATTPRGTKTAMKLPSFKCLEPKDDEAKLVSDESKLPPV